MSHTFLAAAKGETLMQPPFSLSPTCLWDWKLGALLQVYMNLQLK